MAKAKPTSHTFFFTVVFMTSIVLLTVVGYFLFLPNTAPKLITVGVLPFDAPDDFPEHLTRALPRHITELLAASRDVFVVDYDAAEEAVALKNKSRGFRNELGTTHIVDGNFEVVDQRPEQWVLNMRLIDVSKDIWKLKWDDAYAHPELSLLDIRNSIVSSVANGLYDNSIPDPESDQIDSHRLERYLHADSTFRAEHSHADTAIQTIDSEELFSSYVSGLLVELLPDAPMSLRKQWVDQALSFHSNYYPAKILKAQISFEENRNLDSFLDEIVILASDYPNSSAVQELALLYVDLGWFEHAEPVLIRWAQIRPRSSEPALAIAFNRFRLNDLKGVEEALEIARLRGSSNELVDRYRALYQWKVGGKKLLPDRSEYLNWIIRYESDDFNLSDPDWLAFQAGLSCYEQLEINLYLNNLDYIFDKYSCIDRRLWIQPPLGWTDNDPKWLAFKDHPRYTSWLEARGVYPEMLESIEPVPAKELFAPRRRVLNNNDATTNND